MSRSLSCYRTSDPAEISFVPMLALTTSLLVLLCSSQSAEKYEFQANSSQDLSRFKLDEDWQVVWSSHTEVAPPDVLVEIEGLPVRKLTEDGLHRWA